MKVQQEEPSMHRLVTATFVIAAAFAAACGGVSEPSKNVTETFSGTLNVGASNLWNFSSSKNGEVDVRITDLNPSTNVVLGVGLGQPATGGCAVATANGFSSLNRSAVAGPVNKGAYCVLVYDSGALTTPTAYTITVSHP